MISADEVKATFVAELKEFLREWDAEIEVEVDWDGGGARMEAYVRPIWENNECLREMVYIDLGRFVEGASEKS